MIKSKIITRIAGFSIFFVLLAGCGKEAPKTLRDSDDPIIYSSEKEKEVMEALTQGDSATASQADEPIDDIIDFFPEGEGPMPDTVESIDFENNLVYTRFAAFSTKAENVEGLAYSIALTDAYPDTDLPYAPEEFYLSENEALFGDVGEITYIDAIGKISDNLYANLTNYAYWMSEDPEIVDIYNYTGLISLKPGTTTVHVSYGNFTEDITVTVADAKAASSSAATN